MTQDFKRIDMYQCTWCGKLFHTDRLHRCKFRPSYKNCFSCTHCKGVRMEMTKDGHYTDKKIICEEGIPVSILTIAQKQWDLACPKWQIMPDYAGRKTYAERIITEKRTRAERFDDFYEDDDSLPF